MSVCEREIASLNVVGGDSPGTERKPSEATEQMPHAGGWAAVGRIGRQLAQDRTPGSWIHARPFEPYPVPVLGAGCPFLEPFRGLLSPKGIKIFKNRLLIEVRRAWRGSRNFESSDFVY